MILWVLFYFQNDPLYVKEKNNIKRQIYSIKMKKSTGWLRFFYYEGHKGFHKGHKGVSIYDWTIERLPHLRLDD